MTKSIKGATPDEKKTDKTVKKTTEQRPRDESQQPVSYTIKKYPQSTKHPSKTATKREEETPPNKETPTEI